MGNGTYERRPPEDGGGRDRELWSPAGRAPAGERHDGGDRRLRLPPRPLPAPGRDGRKQADAPHHSRHPRPAPEFHTLYGDRCEYEGPGAPESGDEDEEDEDDEYRSPSPQDARDFYTLGDPLDEAEMFERYATLTPGRDPSVARRAAGRAGHDDRPPLWLAAALAILVATGLGLGLARLTTALVAPSRDSHTVAPGDPSAAGFQAPRSPSAVAYDAYIPEPGLEVYVVSRPVGTYRVAAGAPSRAV